MMLHGRPNELVFVDGSCGMRRLSNEIKALNLQNKLRMLYSTACYGASHADDFMKAGFNANAAAEVPVLFTAWVAGNRLRDAVAAGEAPATRLPADAVAAAWCGLHNLSWCGEINSDKVIVGNGNITITSDV